MSWISDLFGPAIVNIETVNVLPPPHSPTVEGLLGELAERIEDMGAKTNEAVAALVEEVADSKGKLASLEATVRGFPEVVAAAVADAMADADVDDATAATAIDQARTEISDAVDSALNPAIEENPLPEDEPPVQ